MRAGSANKRELARPPVALIPGKQLVTAVAGQGDRHVFASEARYPAIEVESVLALLPDVIVLPDEPYAFTAGDAAELREKPGVRVAGPFPGHLATWHGTRTVKGLRFLRELLSSLAIPDPQSSNR